MIRREENVKGSRRVRDTRYIRKFVRKRDEQVYVRVYICVQHPTRKKKRERKKLWPLKEQSAERTGSRHDRESARSIVHQPPRLLLRAPAWRHARKQLVAPVLPGLQSGHSYISWEGKLPLTCPPPAIFLSFFHFPLSPSLPLFSFIALNLLCNYFPKFNELKFLMSLLFHLTWVWNYKPQILSQIINSYYFK